MLTLCIGIVATIAGGTVRELLRAFLAAHADIDLQVVEGAPSEHIGAVRALKMDATFVVGSPPAPGCVVEPMWSEPILVALADDHPLAGRETIAWPQLAAEHFIVSKADPGPRSRTSSSGRCPTSATTPSSSHVRFGAAG